MRLTKQEPLNPPVNSEKIQLAFTEIVIKNIKIYTQVSEFKKAVGLTDFVAVGFNPPKNASK